MRDPKQAHSKLKPSLKREQRLFDALKRIASYHSTASLKHSSERLYGLESNEALEYAYDNVLLEAKQAIRGMRRPVP